MEVGLAVGSWALGIDMASPRMPVVFVPHGGGPWPFVEMGFPREDIDRLAGYLRSVRSVPPRPPRALLVVSAHWEEPVPTVMTSAHPPILYDYYGFPPESYEITWPAPGAPGLASRVRELLTAAGIANAADPARGYDHGTFIPLKLTYPNADVPAIQLSLKRGLDPAEHVALGRALHAAPRRGRVHHRQRHDVPQPSRVSRSARGTGCRDVRRLAPRRDDTRRRTRGIAALRNGSRRPRLVRRILARST